ncbi:putative Ig domain-containing protein, partial [Sphaerisporangium sp. NPDC005288]|uniref:beta strand repeat-containing protein n=1 Tax=Sphaerisporangium sp. NPDC005288 TaxID=3155114 RepID=UPI0033BA047D
MHRPPVSGAVPAGSRGTRRVPARRAAALRRAVARVTFVFLVASTLSGAGGLAPRFANAAGTTLFEQSFKNSTIDATYPVYLPAVPSTSTSNAACLSARGNSGTGLRSCTTNTDANGLGALRFTNTSTFQEGGLFGAVSVPTSQGLDVTFNMYQYGGTGADGMTFVAAAVDPANPLPPANIGQPGGALGYSSTKQGNLAGLANAYLGVGFDVFGNFSNSVYEGSGCTDPPYISTTGGRVPGQVVVRGPGAGTVGYCAVNSTATTTSSSALTLRASTRAASLIPVEVAINPTTATFTTASGLSVPAGTYKLAFTPVGGTQRTLQGTLPTVSSTLYPSASWLNANGIPRQLAFGWVGSTGSVTDFHEIDTAKVVSFNPVPGLTVAQTSYNGSSPQPGGPVTYTVTAGVSASGSSETSPISVTETLPAGVVPVGAFGSGWVCGAPSGQKITCTNGNTPFAAGSTLPEITVVGIVTGGSVTPALIQSSSTVTASSNDANPAIATTTTAGTIPAAPSGITLSSTSGTISGGGTVTVSGANLLGANAIEIGTAAEQQAGTPVVLLPCASGPAAGCFTDNGNGTLTINSMPSRSSAATVTVTVVSDGVAGAANYVYTSVPGTASAPTATAGVTSATVTWTAPAANGSPITQYIVTPYRNGVAQTPVTYDASTTTRTLTGLTAGASYTFTVTAVNAVGTGGASAQSNAVVPYTVPGQPTINSVTAGDLSATLTWTAPSNGSSPITGYIVTPYIGNVAQTPQSFSGTGTTQTVTGLTAGTAYTFTVTAVNAAGPGPASARSTAVTPNANPSLTFPPPPSGQVGVAYSVQLTMTGGTAPVTWSVSAGSLPPGLTLNPSTGLLSGTPTAAGSFPFTVRIVDASGQSDTRAATVVIIASPTLTFPPPPAGQVGVAYSVQLTVSGGTAPYTWSVSAGSLPPGLTLNPSTGLLSGTPTAAGSYPFTVRVVDANGQSDTRAASLVVGAGPLVVTKTADTSSAAPGTVVHYTITVANTSAAAFTGVAFTDPLTDVLDDATYNADVTASSGTAGFTSPNVTWTGDLAGGATATITYSVTVGPAGSGNGTMANTVTSATLGNNCTSGSTDARCRATVRLLALTIAKTADVATTTPGGTVRYTVTVTNAGQTAYAAATFSDALAGVLDDATYNGDASATSGTVTFTSPAMTWTGALAAGGSATITYSVRVNTPDAGDKTLVNAVTSSSAGSNCPTGGSDTRCATSVTALIPRLAFTSATDVSTTTPTGVVHYTVTATNTGQTAYTDANFTFALPGADGVSYNGDAVATSGNLTFNPDGTVTWTGDLAVGQSVTATASITVNNPYTGSGTVTSLVTSTTPGNTCPAGSSDPGCATTVTVLVPQLTITKSTNVSTVTPGGTVTYTVTVANTGPTAYT